MSSIAFQIRASPESNDHQVRIMVDEVDFLCRCDPSLLGLDPSEFFHQTALSMGGELLVGRCGCGVIGCGDELVTVTLGGESLEWAGRTGIIAFPRLDYFDAVREAREDTSWETVERRAERLVECAQRKVTWPPGVTFQWASARLHPDRISVALALEDGGSYQLICSSPWDHREADEAVRSVTDLLQFPMSDWLDVVFYPQNHALPPPPSAGKGWRPHR